MGCNYADTCNDFVEIKGFSVQDANGAKFCKCGLNSGRYTVNENKAVVFFKSADATTTNGFSLKVYATCSGTSASSLTKECVITNSGYDYAGSQTRTDGGATCRPWSGQNTYQAYNFPGASFSSACRNPDSRTSPWCYTTSYSATDKCSTIPQCRKPFFF